MNKNCPMCGEYMKIVDRTQVVNVPGTSERKKQVYQEWVCPECDYFEEFEPEVNAAS